MIPEMGSWRVGGGRERNQKPVNGNSIALVNEDCVIGKIQEGERVRIKDTKSNKQYQQDLAWTSEWH